MANGRVITGFSKPYVGLYSNPAGTNVYTQAQILARGVSVTITPDDGDSQDFYADNVLAESSGTTFNGGSVTLTVDGLLEEAEKLIYGLPTPTELEVNGGSVNIYHYGDGMQVPFVGVGFIIRYMSGGVTTYVPCLLPKVQFNMHETSAETQEDTISFQTEELDGTIYRDETANKDWKLLGEAQPTEAAAEAVLQTLLGMNA